MSASLNWNDYATKNYVLPLNEDMRVFESVVPVEASGQGISFGSLAAQGTRNGFVAQSIILDCRALTIGGVTISYGDPVQTLYVQAGTYRSYNLIAFPSCKFAFDFDAGSAGSITAKIANYPTIPEDFNSMTSSTGAAASVQSVKVQDVAETLADVVTLDINSTTPAYTNINISNPTTRQLRIVFSNVTLAANGDFDISFNSGSNADPNHPNLQIHFTYNGSPINGEVTVFDYENRYMPLSFVYMGATVIASGHINIIAAS